MSSKSRMKRGKGSGDSWIVLIDYTHKAVLQGLQQIGSFELYHQSTIANFFLMFTLEKFFLHPFVACKEKFTVCVIIPLHDHCCRTSRVLSGELMQFLAKSQYAILTIYHLLNSPEVKMCSIIACISKIDGFNLCLNR